MELYVDLDQALTQALALCAPIPSSVCLCADTAYCARSTSSTSQSSGLFRVTLRLFARDAPQARRASAVSRAEDGTSSAPHPRDRCSTRPPNLLPRSPLPARVGERTARTINEPGSETIEIPEPDLMPEALRSCVLEPLLAESFLSGCTTRVLGTLDQLASVDPDRASARP